MPSSSKKQHNFMQAVAHNPEFAKKAGVPQSVGRDFAAADKGRKFGGGSQVNSKKVDPSAVTAMIPSALKLPKTVRNRADLQTVNNPKTNQGKSELFKKGGSVMATKGMNLFKGKETYGEELKEAKAIKSGKLTPEQYAKGEKSEEKKMKKMATGGYVRAADGVASRGKTKAKQVTMKKGGKC
jgi:hypothetical protein